MSVMLVEKPVFLKVDERRLLRELPAFFQSFKECLTELVQNAHRAGATEVTVILNQLERTLVFEDNGSGSDDPQAFLTAGRTGWDESRVTDPAGLGFFSLLGLADQVVVQSRAEGHCGWQMLVTPAAFEGEEVQWDPISESFGPQPHGTRIEAKLGPKADLQLGYLYEHGYSRFCGAHFQHLFPVEIHLTVIGEQGTHQETRPRPTLEGTPALDTPVGRVMVDGDKSVSYYQFTPVWEYRRMQDPIRELLAKELEKLPDGKYVYSALNQHPILWIIDPSSGVRPKLPDRRELIHDESLAAAVRTLALALHQAFDPEAVKAIVDGLNLDDDLSNEQRYAETQVERALHGRLHAIFHPTPQGILRMCGWEECPINNYEDGYIEGYEEDGYSAKIPTLHALVRNPLHVGDDEFAAALNESECWASEAKGWKEVRVHVEGARLASAAGLTFGVCEKITVMVDGQAYQELDRLVMDEAAARSNRVIDQATEEAIPGPCFLLRTDDPEELRQQFRTLTSHRWDRDLAFPYFIYKALTDGYELGDYIIEHSDGDINNEQLENDLIAGWVETFQPENLSAQERYNAIVRVNQCLADATGDFYWLIRDVQCLLKKYPEVTEAGRLLSWLESYDRHSLSDVLWDPSDPSYRQPVPGAPVGVDS